MSRILTVMLALVLSLSLFSSCSAKAFQNNRIDVPEMARLVVDSLQDISVAESLFNLIPDEQKDGLTYSEYYEYISILQKMIPSAARITYFDIVEGNERENLFLNMAGSDSTLFEELMTSCIPVRVTASRQRISEIPIYFYLQTQKDGTVYLSREWIYSCRDLYSFSQHYFEAYSMENLYDVKSLLSYTGVSEDLLSSDEVLTEKAKEMIRFYSTNVNSKVSEYELVSIDASGLVYLQPKVLDTKLHTNARRVRFYSSVENVISVDDSITSELKTADLYLYYGGHRTIRIGETATLSQLESLFGDPISVSCGPVLESKRDSEGNLNEYRNIFVRYSGFAITVYGIYMNTEEWEGSYVRFRIWDSDDAGIGLMLRSDNTSWDILERYPFADKTDYSIAVTIDGEEYVLSFDLADEGEQGRAIQEIRLTWKR